MSETTNLYACSAIVTEIITPDSFDTRGAVCSHDQLNSCKHATSDRQPHERVDLKRQVNFNN